MTPHWEIQTRATYGVTILQRRAPVPTCKQLRHSPCGRACQATCSYTPFAGALVRFPGGAIGLFDFVVRPPPATLQLQHALRRRYASISDQRGGQGMHGAVQAYAPQLV